MTSNSKCMPARRIRGGSPADTEAPREWSPPRFRRLSTSSAKDSPNGNTDAEILS
jgi:hypothetical protein